MARENPAVANEVKYNWPLWRLPHQCPPVFDESCSTWINIGGRGSGKTKAVSELIREDVERGVMAFNFIGRTAAALRDTMVRGETGILSVFPEHQKPVYLSSQSIVRFHTGAVARLLTAECPEAIQGSNAEVTWADEFSTFGRNTEEVWRQIVLSTRVGDPRKYLTTNRMPRNPFLEHLIATASSNRIAVTYSTSIDNFANLPEDFQNQVRQYLKTALGRAWVTGNELEIEGALWKREWISECDPIDVPKGGTTIVCVDPAGTINAKSDETGIIVAKRCGNTGYVLADLSGKHSAEHWPKMVVDAARRYGASAIVIERNRGLDFLAAMIRVHDRHITIREVQSRTGKDDRALPVANIYELGHREKKPRVLHVGHFPELIDQMTTWDFTSQEGQRARAKATSPDRLDALVWAITDLGLCTLTVVGPPKFVPVELPKSRTKF